MSEPKDMLRVSVGDGKYTLIQDHTGRQYALRHGEKWEAGDLLVGCGITLALGYAVDEARTALREAVELLESYHIDWALLNSNSPDYDPDYKIVFPESVQKLREKLEAMK